MGKEKMIWVVRIYDLLDHQNMTIKALRETTGINEGTLNKILSGETKDPSVRKMRSIAHALGCTLDELIDEETTDLKITCNDKDLEVLKHFRQLKMTGQDRVVEYAKLLSENIAFHI